MSINSIGDLAMSFAQRKQSAVLKQQMATLTQELSSGVVADTSRHLSGRLDQLNKIENLLTTLEASRFSAAQGQTEMTVMQGALTRMGEEIFDLGDAALTFSTSGTADADTIATEARAVLSSLIDGLNSTVGGRSLFAGDTTDTRPIVPLDQFIAAIEAAGSGATTVADLEANLNSFFSLPGTGFDTMIYQAGTEARAPYALGDGERLTVDLRADNPVFRNMLKQVSIAALLDSPNLTVSPTEELSILRNVGEQLLASQYQITQTQSDLGFAENRIDRASSRISAEIASMSIFKSDLLAADPFEKATELEATQLQLETLYTLTSRMSRLNLVNFLS